ncbi:TPA: hypothetical protein SBJ50_003006 [Yersinia enterocolitica]|nr:hypothetical protein [Yersinia enterocolitica]HEF8856188.1 hypothetical protein [Yersinia enterocolitica]HEN3229310.1 hypothetical protein [Yersinia enterocolitica]HEN3381364.1 hypothetical protein [Yersinia enterocolitica]HEN3528197.1 hypothetical protein [Yersinia enterocolitica]
MLSKVCKERLEYLASLKGHVGQAVTMCRVELSDISTELLSLREQLAELKKQEPIGQVIFGSYGSDGIREASIVCLHDQADWDNFQDGTLLYLEAKPAED